MSCVALCHIMNPKNKQLFNYIVDVGLFFSFIIAGLTGILKFPRLLPALGIRYSDLPTRLFTVLHDWAGLIMVVLVIIHLVLHWNWIVVMTKRYFGRKKQQPTRVTGERKTKNKASRK